MKTMRASNGQAVKVAPTLEVNMREGEVYVDSCIDGYQIWKQSYSGKLVAGTYIGYSDDIELAIEAAGALNALCRWASDNEYDYMDIEDERKSEE